MDIHFPRSGRGQALNKHHWIPGLSSAYAGIAKEDESKADNLFISFEKMSTSVRGGKQEVKKAKKNGITC